MLQASGHAFDQIPKTINGHFVLYLYAAIYRLIYHIWQLSKVGGRDVPAVFKRYPFLKNYLFEMRKYMPNKIGWMEVLSWWRREIQIWEKGIDKHLPLRALALDGDVGYHSCLAFMAVGLVEEDSRFGTLFAELQAPLGQRRPAFELLGQMIAANGSLPNNNDSLKICGPLIRYGLVDVLNPQSPRSEWILRIPSLLWDAACGQVDDKADSWCSYQRQETSSNIADLIYPAELIAKLKNVPDLITSGKVRALIIRSDYGSDPLEVIGALAKHLRYGVVSVDGGSDVVKDNLKLLGPLCTMTRSMPVLQYDLGPGDTVEPPVLNGYKGPSCFMLGLEGGLSTRYDKKFTYD